jgi:thioredoxin reductase (NADPH)
MARETPVDINYTFSDSDLDTLKNYGDVRRHEQDDLLIEEGQTRTDMLVTLSGETHIFIETPNVSS